MSVERYMVDDAGTLIDKVTLDNFDTVEEVVTLLNSYVITLEELVDENEQLKEIIKFSYFNEICETCKHGKYWITNDFFGKEGNFECLKGHPADECCEIKECKDYEIEDLNELLQWVKR